MISSIDKKHPDLGSVSSNMVIANTPRQCRNPLGEEQRYVGPLVALADTLASLSRLKVLDLSNCALIGVKSNRYHGLKALGNAFASGKKLTHLRWSTVAKQ